MRVIQLTPSLSYGDAVSNDIFAMADVLKKLGFKNEIVALAVADKVKGLATSFSKFAYHKDDVFIYHMSIGSDLTEFVATAKVKCKIMIYHNITPSHFFEGFEPYKTICANGREELKSLAKIIDFALADSNFNKSELIELGYKNVETLPILFDKADYLKIIPDEKVLKYYSNSDFINILFVGRIAPNKKQEDIIYAFHLYNKYINPKSRLFLIGSYAGLEPYETALNQYVDDNNVENVIFLGHISFSELIAYYKLSDAFLCESEHEGFCVPLLEAMLFETPIIAFSSSAVPDTLGNSSIVFTQKNQQIVAELLNLVITEKPMREEIIKKQKERLEFFDIDKTKEKFAKFILPWLN